MFGETGLDCSVYMCVSWHCNIGLDTTVQYVTPVQFAPYINTGGVFTKTNQTNFQNLHTPERVSEHSGAYVHGKINLLNMFSVD